MKKRLALLMCAVLLSSAIVTACGSSGSDTTSSTSEDSEEAAEEEVTEEAAETETSGVAEASAEADNRTVDNPSSEYQTYASDSEYTIGITLQNLDLESITTMKKMLEEDLDTNYPNVKYTILDAQNDQSTQLQQVETFLTQGVDAVILNPVDQEGAQTAVEACVEEGVPCFTLLQKVSDMTQITAHSGMDHTESAALSVSYGMELLGDEGNVADIEGPIGISAQILRTQGLHDILEDYSNVTLVYEETANWARDEAMALAENWLSASTEIDMFFCQCDNMAMGVVQACEEAGVRPIIVSIDGDKDAIQALIDGRLDCTVAINYADMCYHSIDNCIAYLDGQTYNDEYYCELVLITPDNAEEMMETYFGN